MAVHKLETVNGADGTIGYCRCGGWFTPPVPNPVLDLNRTPEPIPSEFVDHLKDIGDWADGENEADEWLRALSHEYGLGDDAA